MSHTNDLAISKALHDLLVDDREISEFLDDLSILSAEHFSRQSPVLCGITMRRRKRNLVVASSSAEAARLDEIQAGFDEGPCMTAQSTNVSMAVCDSETEQRWPSYMAAVRDSGLRSVLALPLPLENDDAKVAMNLYSYEAWNFGEQEIAEAQRYAGLVGRVVQIALRVATHSEIAEHQQRALETRTPINVAVGIIMAQSQCSQDEAFSILQQASSHRNTKLRTLAEEIVASVGQPTHTSVFER